MATTVTERHLRWYGVIWWCAVMLAGYFAIIFGHLSVWWCLPAVAWQWLVMIGISRWEQRQWPWR